MRSLASVDLGIQRIYTTCVDTNQYLSGSRLRSIDGTDPNRLSRRLSYRSHHGELIGVTVSIESARACHGDFRGQGCIGNNAGAGAWPAHSQWNAARLTVVRNGADFI
jgi:hypothetical protein